MLVLLHNADQRAISGTFTSLIDLSNSLTDFGIFHSLVINCTSIKVALVYKHYLKKFCNPLKVEFKFLSKDKINQLDAHTLIMTSEMLSFSIPPDGIKNDYLFGFDCRKIIMLDSAGFWTAEMEDRLDRYYECLPSNIPVHFLCNTFNAKYSRFTDTHIYYHKFSRKRLDFLKSHIIKKNGILKSSDSIPIEGVKYIDHKKDIENYHSGIHSFAEYHYCRWYQKKGVYQENIGKLLFEYRYFDTPVRYYPFNKSFDDGLTYYLKLFEIDDSIEQDLIISASDISSKLFMSDNDLLLKLL